MRRFAFKTVLFTTFFAFFFALINIGFLAIIRYTDWDYRKRIETLNFENPDLQLIILGASMTLDAIDAEMITVSGIKSYNFALGGNTFRTSYIQLAEYLTKCSIKPNHVLLGMFSVHETMNEELVHPIVEFTRDEFEYTIRDFPILKFRWLGTEFLKKVVSQQNRRADLSLGQLRFHHSIPDTSSYKESYLNLQKIENSFWIGEIVKLCDENDIKMVILEMPGFKEFQNRDEIGPYTLTFQNGHSSVLYNFNSIEFCEIFDYNTDWIGNSHLNSLGAEKLTKEVIEILNCSSGE